MTGEDLYMAHEGEDGVVELRRMVRVQDLRPLFKARGPAAGDDSTSSCQARATHFMPVDKIEEWTSVDPKDHEIVEIP